MTAPPRLLGKSNCELCGGLIVPGEPHECPVDPIVALDAKLDRLAEMLASLGGHELCIAPDRTHYNAELPHERRADWLAYVKGGPQG